MDAAPPQLVAAQALSGSVRTGDRGFHDLAALVGADRADAFLDDGGGGAGFFSVALERVAEADNEGLVRGELAGDLLGFEVGELLGERDARQVRDLPSVADTGDGDAEAHSE